MFLTHSRLGKILLYPACLALGLPVQAESKQWQAPAYFETSQIARLIALDEEGNAHALGFSYDDGKKRFWASHKTKGAANWSPSKTIAEGSEGKTLKFLMDFDAKGNAWALWANRESTHAGTLYLAHFDRATGEWSNVETVQRWNVNAMDLCVMPDGRALIVYTSLPTPKRGKQACFFPHGANSFGPPPPKRVLMNFAQIKPGQKISPVLLGEGGYHVYQQLIKDGEGRALLVYGGNDGYSSRLILQNGEMTEAVSLPDSIGDYNKSLHCATGGNCLLLSDSGKQELKMTWFHAQSGWSETTSHPTEASADKVGMDGKGRLRVAWDRYHDTISQVKAMSFHPSEGWSPIQHVSSSSSLGNLCVGQDGTAILTETRHKDQEYQQYFRMAFRGGEWGEAQPLPFVDKGAQVISITVNPKGQAAILFSESTQAGTQQEAYRWGSVEYR